MAFLQSASGVVVNPIDFTYEVFSSSLPQPPGIHTIPGVSVPPGTIVAIDDTGNFELVTALPGNQAQFNLPHGGFDLPKPHPPVFWNVSVRSVVITLPYASKVGDWILVSFGRIPALNGAEIVITDSDDNEYQEIFLAIGSGFGNLSAGCFYTRATTDNQLTLAVSVGGFQFGFQGNSYSIAVAVDCYDGLLSFDQVSTAVESGGGGFTGDILTPAQANELQLVIAVPQVGTGSVFTDPSGGWTIRNNLPSYIATWDRSVSALPAPPGYSATPAASGGVVAFLCAIVTFTVAALSQIDIVTDISERAGLTAAQIDVSKLLVSGNFPTLGNVVPGYFIERPTPAAQILRVLMGAYFFDACEEDGKVRYVPRGAAPALTIPEGDLGLVTDKRKLIEQQGQEQDLPKQIVVIYPDPALDYQQGNQPYSRNVRTVHTRNQEIKSIPITMPGTQAKQIAQISVYTAWMERDSYAMNLWRAIYMRLSPTDVLQFVYEGLTFTMRAVENSLGAGYAVAIQGVSEDARNYISTAVAAVDAGFSPGPMILAALTTLFLFDIPLLADTDSNPDATGYYYAMSSLLATWPGAVLYDSSDDVAFAAETTDNQPVSFGTATTVLGAPRSPWIWDRTNTLTIRMAFGALAGDTMLNVLNGSNTLIVGNEIMQYTTAVQNMDGTFTISGLLRGRRGTEWACGTHAVGDLVFVVASPATIRRMDLPLAIVNLLRFYRAVTIGQDPTTAATQNFTITGADLKPYAPVHIKGTRDGGGNLTLTWVRRTRIGWRSLSQDPVPLSEDSELYEVDILNGANVVRTITGITSPTAAYTAAEQVADVGAVQANVAVKVYQVSAQVGKGFAGQATV